MLGIPVPARTRYCDGLTRRHFLKIGGVQLRSISFHPGGSVSCGSRSGKAVA
jgi:hypothetical protein